VERAEQSAINAKRQASRTGQSVHGAGLKVLSAEISANRAKGAKCQRTEQSVDRHGAPSVERGGIRGRHRVQDAASGGLRDR
jgi:hypothetical protein